MSTVKPKLTIVCDLWMQDYNYILQIYSVGLVSTNANMIHFHFSGCNYCSNALCFFCLKKKKHPPQSYCEIWHDQQGLFSFMAVPQLQGLLAAWAYQVIQRSWPISFPKNQSTNSSDSNFTIIIRIFLNDFALSTHHCILKE